jgi:hypothetical protein
MLHVQVTELPKWSGIIFLLMAISTIGKRRTESNNKEVSYLLNYHRTHLFFLLVRCMLLACRAQEYIAHKNTRCRPRAHLFFSWSVACRTNEVLRANFSDWIPYRATFFSPGPPHEQSPVAVDFLAARVPPPLLAPAPCGRLIRQCLSPFVHLCLHWRALPRPIPTSRSLPTPLMVASSTTIHLPVHGTLHSQEIFHDQLVAASSAGTQLPVFCTFPVPQHSAWNL